jgi:hypothetical protein
LEAKRENTFSIFQEWCPFSNENGREEIQRKEKKQRIAQIYTQISVIMGN